MPCCSSIPVNVMEHRIFQEPIYCVLADTPLLSPSFFFLLKLIPWSFLWKLIGFLLLPCTKHRACHLVPSAYRKPIRIYYLAVNLASPPNLERVFCIRHFKLFLLSLTEMKCGEDNSAYHLTVTELCTWCLCHIG